MGKELSVRYVMFSCGGLLLGRVAKGVKCSVAGCGNPAVRSIATLKATAAGLKVGSRKRAYLCKEHYKEYRKETKKDKMLEKWRYRV